MGPLFGVITLLYIRYTSSGTRILTVGGSEMGRLSLEVERSVHSLSRTFVDKDGHQLSGDDYGIPSLFSEETIRNEFYVYSFYILTIIRFDGVPLPLSHNKSLLLGPSDRASSPHTVLFWILYTVTESLHLNPPSTYSDP